MSTNFDDYKRLSVAERIQLVEDIWDSIAAEEPEALRLSEAQETELRRRAEAHRVNPATSVPWEEVREKLFQHSS